MNPLFQLSLALAVSMLIIPLIGRAAPRLGLVDMPDPRKVHRSPVPRVGGWGITLGMLLPLLLFLRLDPLLLSFVGGTVVLFVFGIWDDARTIGHWPKFVGQFVAAGLIVFQGDLWVSRLPFLDFPVAAAFGKPFTMVALVGVINAINHSDGLDGLAAGESLLSLIAMAIIGYMAGSPVVMGVALATMGGILGFLRYNSHPANVFMGDCGSQVLGFSLGFLALYLTQTASNAISAALPLLVLGVPIADILSVLYQRIHGGMNWFRATRNHLHHRLLDLGFDHYATVVFIYSIQATLVIAAVVLRYESDVTVTLVYLAVILGVFGAVSVAERRGWHAPGSLGAGSVIARWIARQEASRRLQTLPLAFITIVTPLLLILSAALAAHIPGDFSAASGLMAILAALEFVLPAATASILARLTIYGTAIFAAYLITHYPGVVPEALPAAGPVVVVGLAVATACYIRVAGGMRFGTTPTDYLIVFGVVVLTLLGVTESLSRQVVEAILYAIVLMYACEVIMNHATGRRVLHLATLTTLSIFALRGLI